MSSAPDATQQAAIRSRRRYLAAGFGVLFAGVLAGGWLISHSMARQLAAARLQSDFVSAVSHEFRTPLTTLCQLSELLKRGRVAREDDRQQYYELLHSESDRLRRLVESLLAFGRLEAGRAPFRLEPTDVETLVKDAAEQFGSSNDLDGHRIDIDVNGSLPAVPADREGLRTVLWNLFENAVKYSPARERIYVTLSAQSRSVVICVRDDGIGIPVAEQRQIFDRFVRGTAARDRNIRGTGIGLAMVRQIVQAHGGEITVESTPGVGSTFRIALPSASAGVTAHAQGRPS